MRALILTLAVAVHWGCAGPSPALTLATTTSVGNSGLLDVLLPAFERQHGITVHAHLVGSGRALAMLEDGQADVVVSHAPGAERGALARHANWSYRKIMFNDFVITGPPDDPAGVRGSADAAEAMRRIARSGATFISRGDESGTHERERHLWTQAGAAPPEGQLVVAGAGMGTTLRVTSEAGAYTLTDRGTLAHHAGALRLAVLFEGGSELVNTYSVIVREDGPRAHDAALFARWLASGDGRALIANYRVGTVPAFEPWPVGRPGAAPGDLPK